jgi:hypothetical protein
MFSKIFSSQSNQVRKVHCEITGKECSLNDTVILTKVNGVIVFKNIDDPELDEDEQVIYTPTKPPLKYYSEINVPNDLKQITGRLFSIVDDEDDLEQSTAVMSFEGQGIYTGRQLVPFLEYMNEYEMLQLPDTMFMAIIDSVANAKQANCENWNLPFNSVGRKYRFKRILEERKSTQTFGIPALLIPGYDVGLSDCSQKNPQGTGYLFKTDNNFVNINFACNESAVEYCIKNKCLVYYSDFLNKGSVRILSPYSEDINRKLQNSYLFRSSNM